MPFRRPSLRNLRAQNRATFAAKLPGADGTLIKSIIGVVADVIAGLVNSLFGYGDWLARQALPNTADDWFFLLRWGDLKGITPNPATGSTGTAIFTGTAGTDVPNHTELQYTLEDGSDLTFRTTADTELIAGNTSIPVEAVTLGAAGNLPAGAKLILVTAIAGVDGTATVGGDGLSGALDAETPRQFGARVADRFRNPPGGSGTAADYERWAKSISGVTRAKATGAERGPGTVNVRFVFDGRDDIIPLSGDIAAVQAVFDADKPLTDDALALAPVVQIVNYQLSDALVPVEVRDAIAAALAAMHRNLVIGAGLSIQGQVIPAITAVATLTGTFLIAPTADIPPDVTKVLVLGTIAYL